MRLHPHDLTLLMAASIKGDSLVMTNAEAIHRAKLLGKTFMEQHADEYAEAVAVAAASEGDPKAASTSYLSVLPT